MQMPSLAAAALCAGIFGLIGVANAASSQIAGAVDADGKRQVKSSQYTVTHPSKGRYIIHFTTPFPAPYATCLFMPVEATAANGLVEKTTSCDVTFVDSEGNLMNTIFNFLAVVTTN